MEITEFLVLASQLDSPEDNLLVGPFFLLDYSDVVGLSPGRSTRLRVVEQLCYRVQIKPSFDPTQSIGHLVIGAFEVFDGHVIAGQGGDPTVAQGIEIWCHKNISERVVVRQHGEWPVLQVFPELFCNGSLKSQELQLGRMVFGLSPFQLTTSESNGVPLAVWLLLGEYGT